MIRSTWAGGLFLALAMPFSLTAQAQPLAVGNVLESKAVQTPQAVRSVFTSIARAGERLVAVGERGVIVFSDDNGEQWRQASVPVSVSLTAVDFVDSQHGWAVGHSGVVLASRDSGETWELQLNGLDAAQLELAAAQQALLDAVDADVAQARLQTAERLVDDGADKPFLNLHFTDAQHGVVVGAYGMAFQTRDGGKSWQSMMGQIDNAWSLHIYAIAQHGDDWYLAGEQGFLAHSSDAGQHFQKLESPYEGTFFTLVADRNGELLLGGLKGNAFVLRQQGAVIEPVAVPMPVSFSDGTFLGDGRVLLANQAGAIFTVDAESNRLQLLLPPQGKPITALTQAADGRLVIAGFTGISHMPLPAVKVSE
ncbi:YCF48-related protein [Pseudomonas sp. ML96]|uniref:WD40/YVTN/BNR-like repeat-containing protein n=1 Tax=Pseudomonas sp. ML96 TaxID=1523503 RepID=UPI0005B8F68B|nr:YCF48-related protein [Pseudomonas sp. ML96]